MLKIIFYDCVGIKTNVVRTGFIIIHSLLLSCIHFSSGFKTLKWKLLVQVRKDSQVPVSSVPEGDIALILTPFLACPLIEPDGGRGRSTVLPVVPIRKLKPERLNNLPRFES